jgi:hypothetical protein
MSFSREHPSRRYGEMLALYRQLHREGESFLGLPAESTYPGVSVLPHLARIRKLIEQTGARTLLDYGCGKGIQYELAPVKVPGEGTHDSVIDYWDLDEVCCYDPCYQRFERLPEGQFDGVIATDVLEHCPEEDLAWIVGEMFGYARRFVFASVASYPAKSRLPTGENAHCTIRPVAWWQETFAAAAARHPAVVWKLHVEEKVAPAGSSDGGRQG